MQEVLAWGNAKQCNLGNCVPTGMPGIGILPGRPGAVSWLSSAPCPANTLEDYISAETIYTTWMEPSFITSPVSTTSWPRASSVFTASGLWIAETFFVCVFTHTQEAPFSLTHVTAQSLWLALIPLAAQLLSLIQPFHE